MSHDKDNAFDDLIQLVSFKLGREEFGIDILKVQEINRTVEITHVPQAPPYVEGVINLRGKVIPVVNLRTKFGLKNRKWDKNTRIIVADVSGAIIGMVVDGVNEVLRIPRSTIEPPPEIVTSVDTEYFSGVAKIDDRLLIFLDITRLAGEVGELTELREEAMA